MWRYRRAQTVPGFWISTSICLKSIRLQSQLWLATWKCSLCRIGTLPRTITIFLVLEHGFQWYRFKSILIPASTLCCRLLDLMVPKISLDPRHTKLPYLNKHWNTHSNFGICFDNFVFWKKNSMGFLKIMHWPLRIVS